MKRFICLAILVLLASGCSSRTDAPVQDLVNLPQDAGFYHSLPDNERLISVADQQLAYDHFIEEHFGPWDRTEPKHPARDVFWGFAVYGEKKLYGENTLLRSPGWITQQATASRMAKYPSMSRMAITTVNTSMRVFPTHRPAFYDFARAGEGFPFDYMQNSLVLAGTPLYASHMSEDGGWVMVESRFAFGWVPVRDIGWVDDAFIEKFKTGHYGALTRDDVAALDNAGVYRFPAHIGTILPYASSCPSEACVLVPIRDEAGNAKLATVSLAADSVATLPLAATPANFTRLIDTMLGRQYGWGGLYEDRDCSSTLMDLMASFGIYLPRNSSQQIKVGEPISLEGLNLEDKKERILETSTPFLTMVRKPGHIMLYIGQRDGQPVVFHSVWGLKTKTGSQYGRKVIGGAVITSLEPGLELPDLVRPDGILLETVYTTSTLPNIEEK